ncbi:hypothetical protein RN11_2475 [Mycobacterium tuberculosis]|nr:hypothetical protein RN11_2475 [Mycobacterium tuberculosis]
MAGALFEPSFAAAHPAGLLRRPVTRTVVLSVAATSIAHMFEISLPDPTELCRSDDGALVAAIEDCARVEAAASARRLSAIAELTGRRTGADQRADWACDFWDCAAAEVAAALTISHGKASGQMHLSLALNRLPQVAALFLAGHLGARLFSIIAWRTYLVRDPHALSLLDAALAEHAGAWGPLSAPNWKRPSTPGSIATIPGRCGAAVSRPAPATYASVIPMRTPAPPRCGAGCMPPTPRCWIAGSPRWPTACARMTRAPWPSAAPTRWARWPPAPTTWRAAAASPTAPPVPATTSGPPVWSSTSSPTPQHLTHNPTHTYPATNPLRGPHPGDDPVRGVDTRPRTRSPATHAPAELITTGGGVVPAPLLAELIRGGATISQVRHPGDLAAEPHYRPSAKLAEFVRMRDLTCRFPGCDVPAEFCDIDHSAPWPLGPTHPSNLKCACRKHHLLKTFWTGWRDVQLPDGTVIWTAPNGHTYTTHPGSRIFFPTWHTTTAELPQTSTAAVNVDARGLMMPRRRRTRAAELAHRINAERALNDAYMAERNKPPSF